MSYKYNITYVDKDQKKCKNFKNRTSMCKYLNSNMKKINNFDRVKLNFNQVCLPLKDTVWYM